jgi:hypothetical protein
MASDVKVDNLEWLQLTLRQFGISTIPAALVRLDSRDVWFPDDFWETLQRLYGHEVSGYHIWINKCQLANIKLRDFFVRNRIRPYELAMAIKEPIRLFVLWSDLRVHGIDHLVRAEDLDTLLESACCRDFISGTTDIAASSGIACRLCEDLIWRREQLQCAIISLDPEVGTRVLHIFSEFSRYTYEIAYLWPKLLVLKHALGHVKI